MRWRPSMSLTRLWPVNQHLGNLSFEKVQTDFWDLNDCSQVRDKSLLCRSDLSCSATALRLLNRPETPESDWFLHEIHQLAVLRVLCGSRFPLRPLLITFP